MSRKYTIEEAREFFGNDGYTLISTEYVNVNIKLDCICPNGHECSISLSKFLNGRRCLCESGRTRLTIEYIRKEFKRRSYTLVSTEYKSGKKLEYICPNGHRHSIRWDHFQAGHGCPYCNGKEVITIEGMRAMFEEEGYTLLTPEYINSKQKFEYICPNRHHHSITRNNWITGYRCPECSPTMKKTIEFIRDEFSKEGYELVTTDYENHHQKLHTICPAGHDYYVSWSNWQQHKSKCVKCSEWGTSDQENKLVGFIEMLCNNVKKHDRSLVGPHELDIVLPDEKIAIEYCGLYWHSELMGKNRTYHFDKLIKCKEKGYRLLTIFEDELVFNEAVVFSRLRNILKKGVSKNIYARKCVVSEITVDQARQFCDNNHVQGYGSGSSVRLGAFYNDELVSVMTFSKPSIAKGLRNEKDGVWELNRFCSKINYHVVGIASKLLKHFERNYDWSKIYSYADRRWSDGNVYGKIGFNFTGFIRPNYWYIKKQKRIHRFALRKTRNDPKDTTEWEIRKSQGWNRIWDCGNLKFEKVPT